MSEPTWQIIEGIVSSRTFSRFLGMREGPFLEVKGSTPYDFKNPAGRYELAKDVSAFANADGGWLLIGLTTTRLKTEVADEITGLDLISNAAFPEAQIHGVLKEYLYPTINGLNVCWIEDAANQGVGVGVVHVPAQSDERKPVLIAKVVEEGDHMKQIVFGFAKRVGGDGVPHTPEQMHRSMKVGMHSTAQRLTAIEEKLERLMEAQAQTPAPPAQPQVGPDSGAAKLAARIADILIA